MVDRSHTQREDWCFTRTGLPLLALLVVVGCSGDKTKPLQVPPDKYRQMVSAFYTGTLALVVGDNKRAQPVLTEATKIIPEEPATWANLAVLALRNHDLERMAQSLEKAQSLSPPNSGIEVLSGVLASRQGRLDEALAHYRKAVELDPGNLSARYAITQELARQPGSQSDAEIEQQLQQIIQAQPGNLVALIDLTRLAARTGNAEALRRRIGQLKAISGSWLPNARQKLQELEKEAAGSDTRRLVTQIAILGNLLKQNPAYSQSYAALNGPDNTPAQPLQTLVRLPSPRPTPAPPDTGLTFATEPISATRAAWARALPLAPAAPPDNPKPNEPPPVDAATAVVAATGKTIVLDTNLETTLPPTLPFPGPASVPEGLLLADWNNDYRPDLTFAGSTGLRLFQQGTASRWMDVTAKSGLPTAVTSSAYTGAWAIDVDLEGDLDVVLGTATGSPRVLRNNGDGTWAVVQPFSGVAGIRDLAWADLDGDVDADVAVIDQAGKLIIFENERAGHYRRLPSPATAGKLLALSVADANQDGALDLTILTEGGGIHRVSHRASVVSAPSGAATTGEGVTASWEVTEIARWEAAPADGSARLAWADLDNNGALDLIASGRQGGSVWLGGEQGALSRLAAPLDARVFSAADLNDDGRLDMVGVSKTGEPVRLINHGTKSYHWQLLRPRGDIKVRSDPGSSGNQKINSFGLGGEAELRAGLLTQKQPITGPAVHFGLGDQTAVNFARLIWPNGQIQGEFDLKADQAPLAKQRLTGSCPWLFAHDGSSMKFVTDILWKSPLGLRINAQNTAGVSQTLDWVKVRGDQLKPRGGFYDLSITAELWETNFFDHVSLMTVDHPKDTEFFVDERFAIPQPPLKLHAMTPPQPIARARDDQGRDVTEKVRHRDGIYLDGFGLGRYQGVTRDHWVEVELPDVGVGRSASSTGEASLSAQRPTPNAERLFLVASGWVYPTDSSINVALSQGKHDPPQGLSLEVQDARGRWVTAKKGLGFPAGKLKTVLIDLTDVLVAPNSSPATLRSVVPKRLRLRTNLEVYWDSIAVATGLPETRLQTRRIEPQVAELRYRGFSSIHQADRSSPELPEYNDLAGTSQQWLDLVGFYTRFGDVRELLKQVDDRYIIMNAGDEIALRFPAPPPPPAGWTRDYVFISDGWDKDGNFNTGFSKTVLPLPSHDQPEYSRPPGRLEDDPVYRRHARDWQQYHTRYVTPHAVRTALWRR